jgi:hypothetical protein
MDEQAVREHAQAHCDALVAGDIDGAAAQLSKELRSNLGHVLTLLPLPLTAATVDAVERTGTGYLAVLHLVGETDEVRLQTRWKDRDGQPTIVWRPATSSRQRRRRSRRLPPRATREHDRLSARRSLTSRGRGTLRHDSRAARERTR